MAETVDPPPESSEPLYKRFFPQFREILEARLARGVREYGDGSFSEPPDELLREMQEEVLDVAGWGFILWVRLQRLRERAGDL